MTPEETMQLAKEAGLKKDWFVPWDGEDEAIQRFAALVEAKAAAKEREACAQVCSDKAMRCESEAQFAIENGELDEVSSIRSTAWQISICAADIRARGQQ